MNSVIEVLLLAGRGLVKSARRARRAGASLALVAAILVAVPCDRACADTRDLALVDPAAAARMDRGSAYFSEKNYSAAVVELEAAYGLEPRREILFGWAQAERLRGNCPAATALYRRFLDADPPASQGVIAKRHIEVCAAVMPRPWYRDQAGDALLGLSLAALAVGVGTEVGGAVTIDHASRASLYADYRAQVDAGHAERITAAVTFAVSGALLVGSIARYVVVTHRR